MSDKVLMPIIQSFIEKQQKKALSDPQKRSDMTIDSIYLTQKIYVMQSVKLLRLFYQIIFIVYFYGQLWYALSAALYDYTIDENDQKIHVGSYTARKNQTTNFTTQTFIDNYGKWTLLNIDGGRRSIINSYFAFTTMASIGFGDFYPVSVYERGSFVLIFLFGVVIFSYFMENFQQLLQHIQKLDHEDNDQ